MSGHLRRWAWVWLPLALWVTCAGWALSSPTGSSPDDDYHLSSIWCAGGARTGVCEEVPGEPGQRLVPRNVVQAADCYRYDGGVNAGCTFQVRSDASMVLTDRVNEVAGLYPTGYYRVMSVFVGPDVDRSVLSMRLVNAGLVAVLLALLLRTVPRGIRAATVVAFTVTFIPLGLFVVASTNPSGWAAAGVLLFWGFAFALLQRGDWRSRRTWLIAAGALASALMAVTSRVDASAFIALAAVLVFILGWRPRARQTGPAALVVAALGLVGALGYLLHPTPGAVGDATMGSADRGAGLLVTNAVYLPALIQGVVGGGQLGWNDTVMPPIIPIVGVLVLGGLMWAGLSQMWPRKSIATVIAFVALLAVPLWFLQKEGLGVGEVVQPRYLLPLLALLVATILVSPRLGRAINFSRIPLAAASVGLIISAVIAFWANAHRYAAGDGVGLFDPKMHPAWITSAGVPLALTTTVTVLASVTWIAGALLVASREPVGERTRSTN